ncbi:flagellin A [Bartonella schoenbuchensis]|uniref:Flagellin A n=1 Tax=Bartonella schoenbuchensis m07a TaxID=1094496 RepID=N6VB92_9HYPH|nr:flagellin A [Bartonella schoenbuchensis]ENN90531.1 flagellin A [Bartonella schoenbuchensis m07a]
MAINLFANQSAVALQTVQSIDNHSSRLQDQREAELQIRNTPDHAAYESISPMMKYDSATIVSVVDAIKQSKEQVEVAKTVVELTKGSLDTIEKLVISAYTKGAEDFSKIQDHIAEHVKDLSYAIEEAAISAGNIVANGGMKAKIPSSYRHEGLTVYVDSIEIGGPELNFGVLNIDGTIDMSKGILKNIFNTGTTTNFDATKVAFDTAQKDFQKLKDTLIQAKTHYATDPSLTHKVVYNDAQQAIDDNARNNETLNKAKAELKTIADGISLVDFVKMRDVDQLSTEVRDILFESLQNNIQDSITATLTAEAKINSTIDLINIQPELVKTLAGNIDSNIRALVDINMDAQSARLSALQIQKQLSAQTFPIANQNTYHTLALSQK